MFYSYPQSDIHINGDMMCPQLLFVCWCSSILAVTCCFEGTAHHSGYGHVSLCTVCGKGFMTSHLVVYSYDQILSFFIIDCTQITAHSYIPVINHSRRLKGNV